MKLHAISLWQPWASLMVKGYKLIETRHWALPKKYEDMDVYIHAAKRQPTAAEMANVIQYEYPEMNGFPFGAIIGRVRFKKSVEMESAFHIDRIIDDIWGNRKLEKIREYGLGHYAAGRHAWLTFPGSAVEFEKPIPYSGSQGFFLPNIDPAYAFATK